MIALVLEVAVVVFAIVCVLWIVGAWVADVFAMRHEGER